MTKFEFMLECVDKVFSVGVSGNFIIENYTNLNIFDFYKTIFDDYVTLSDSYDQTTFSKELSLEEVDTRLMTFINVATEESLTLFLSSLEKIVKDHEIKYDVKASFESISKENKQSVICDIFNKMLIEIRKIEETAS